MSHRRGFILLAMSMALAVLAVLTFSLGKSSGLAARTAARAIDAERARLLAEAGLAHALRNMQAPAAADASANVCTVNQNFTLGAAGTTTTYLAGELAGIGAYTVGFVRPSPDSNGDPLPLWLEAVGTLNNGAKHVMRLPLPTLSFALPGWVWATQAIAASAPPEADTFVRSSAPWGTYYWDHKLEIDGLGGGVEQALLRFDLAKFPGLASNSRVVFVRLGLYRGDNGTHPTATAHRITESWTEEDTSWNNRESGTPWITQGGTHDTTALGTMNIHRGAGMHWMELDTSIVGNWLTENNGLLLKANTNMHFDFYSIDGDPTFRMRAPRLEIVYLKGC